MIEYVAGRDVSLQITILNVLAGHPDGRASLAELNRCVGILVTSGPDWSNRTKRLAARVPDLDIFSQSLILGKLMAGRSPMPAERYSLPLKRHCPPKPKSNRRRRQQS